MPWVRISRSTRLWLVRQPRRRSSAVTRPQPRLLVAGQPVLLATVDAVLAHPVAQRRVVDPKLPGDLGDRPATGANQLDRVAFELGGELAPVPSLSVFHADILLPREVSCLRGEVHFRRRRPGVCSLLKVSSAE